MIYVLKKQFSNFNITFTWTINFSKSQHPQPINSTKSFNQLKLVLSLINRIQINLLLTLGNKQFYKHVRQFAILIQTNLFQIRQLTYSKYVMLKNIVFQDDEYPTLQNIGLKHCVQIRKKNREEQFIKRRRQQVETNDDNSRRIHVLVDQRYDQLQNYLRDSYDPSSIRMLIQELSSQDFMVRHHGVIGVRKILSSTANHNLTQISLDHLVEKLFDVLAQKEYPQLQLQAMWAITNIASGNSEQNSVIVEHNGLQLIIAELDNKTRLVVQQSIWALGNMACDNAKNRDYILGTSAIELMINHVQEARLQNDSRSISIINETCWALTTIMRGRPLPPYLLIQKALLFVCNMVDQRLVTEPQNVVDCFWAISYYCETDYQRDKLITETYMIETIIGLFVSDKYEQSMVTPCIRIVGNVVAGKVHHSAYFLQKKGFDMLVKLIYHKKKIVRKEVCWIMSNIAASGKQQATYILSDNNMVQKLTEMFKTDQVEIRKQVAIIFSNLMFSFKDDQMQQIYISCGFIDLYFKLMIDGSKFAMETLTALEYIIVSGQKKGNSMIVEYIKQQNLDEVIELLQQDQNQEVAAHAARILSIYFSQDKTKTSRLKQML